MGQFRNVCFTLNNPVDMIMFDPAKMDYLVYQEEISDSGTYHFQGYCEFTDKPRQNTAKARLGGAHIERRRGSQEQAIAYCKDEAKRVPHTEPYEDGTPRTQGKRMDLESFKDEVMAGKRKRDLLDEHWGVIARYPKFYEQLTMMHRPERTTDLVVTLLIGETGTGKTRSVEDLYGADEDFYRLPLNNGTMWYDTYDGHKIVLIDDFAGRASKFSLCALLQLLDRYSILVPTKGSHTWWMPDAVFITTNILPRDWYDWKTRESQYWALARRFHKVFEHFLPLPNTDRGYTIEQDSTWWKENQPDTFIGANIQN